MMGIRGYGESEFVYSSIKVIAILGFIILAIVSEYRHPMVWVQKSLVADVDSISRTSQRWRCS